MSTGKKTVVHLRKVTKILALMIIASLLIFGTFTLAYRPTYKVTLDGEFIGYTSDKSGLQKRINDYIDGKSQGIESVAFVDIASLPEYEMIFLNEGEETNDDEIFNVVTKDGVTYYKFFSITLDNEDKYFVGSYAEAQEVIEKLKEKDTNNLDEIGVLEKYGTELSQLTDVETAVNGLYEAKPIYDSTATYYGASGTVTYSVGRNNTSQVVDIGISLVKPVTINHSISSRYGNKSTRNHSGLDIAAPTGTPIYAAAAGYVEFSGNCDDGYGNQLVINSGNGLKICYGHASALVAKAGQYVSQGELIAYVGSTGYSTGPHLHFEIRYNGILQDPENYVNY